MSVVITHPGTPMNVTPLIEAPIMPKATNAQGDFRPALKNASLPPLPLRRATISNTAKYISRAINIDINSV
jgi:hypothetical protein